MADKQEPNIEEIEIKTPKNVFASNGFDDEIMNGIKSGSLGAHAGLIESTPHQNLTKEKEKRTIDDIITLNLLSPAIEQKINDYEDQIEQIAAKEAQIKSLNIEIARIDENIQHVEEELNITATLCDELSCERLDVQDHLNEMIDKTHEIEKHFAQNNPVAHASYTEHRALAGATITIDLEKPLPGDKHLENLAPPIVYNDDMRGFYVLNAEGEKFYVEDLKGDENHEAQINRQIENGGEFMSQDDPRVAQWQESYQNYHEHARGEDLDMLDETIKARRAYKSIDTKIEEQLKPLMENQNKLEQELAKLQEDKSNHKERIKEIKNELKSDYERAKDLRKEIKNDVKDSRKMSKEVEQRLDEIHEKYGIDPDRIHDDHEAASDSDMDALQYNKIDDPVKIAIKELEGITDPDAVIAKLNTLPLDQQHQVMNKLDLDSIEDPYNKLGPYMPDAPSNTNHTASTCSFASTVDCDDTPKLSIKSTFSAAHDNITPHTPTEPAHTPETAPQANTAIEPELPRHEATYMQF